MATKTISITEAVYKKLLSEKHDRESFSDVLGRLVSRRRRLSDSFGKWVMTDAEAGRTNDELRKVWTKWESEYK